LLPVSSRAWRPPFPCWWPRAVQGVFAALLDPTDLAAINVVFTRRRERDRIVAVCAVVMLVGAVLVRRCRRNA